MLKKNKKETAVKKHIFNVRIFRYLGPVIYTKSNQTSISCNQWASGFLYTKFGIIKKKKSPSTVSFWPS